MSVPFFAKRNGDWIRATPLVAGNSIYVPGMRDVLVCLNAEDGSEVWRIDFVERFGTPLPGFGFVSSPLADGDYLYTQAGGGVIKLNRATGEVIWRKLTDEGGMYGSAFSSPILTDLAGKRQLIVQTRSSLAGVDPEDGEVLWQQPVKAFRGMNILTPVVHEDLLFTSTYGGRTAAYAVRSDGTTFSVEAAWTHRAQGYMSTPVVIADHVYHHLRSQRVVCIDLRDGTERWTEGKGFGKYWSMVANGERILALDQKGILYLIQANTQTLEIVDQRRISETDTWAHLAVSGDQLYTRSLNALTAYTWKPDPGP